MQESEQMAKFWQPVRLSLLVMVLGGVLGVLGRAIVVPKVEEKSIAKSYPLPPTVPLSGWQFSTSTPLRPDTSSNLPAGQRYQYRNGTTSLAVEARVMGGDDNISRFLNTYTPIGGASVNLKLKTQPDGGFYGVLAHGGQAYLSACINRHGNSTVTEQQFRQNRHIYDLEVGRVLPWLLGQETLIDRRCLWTLMVTPLSTEAKPDPITSEKAFKTLETAWFSWYQWWQPNFLKP
jgi:cyanosortase A-associated protein